MKKGIFYCLPDQTPEGHPALPIIRLRVLSVGLVLPPSALQSTPSALLLLSGEIYIEGLGCQDEEQGLGGGYNLCYSGPQPVRSRRGGGSESVGTAIHASKS